MCVIPAGMEESFPAGISGYIDKKCLTDPYSVCYYNRRQ